MPVSLGELAVRFGCELRGDPDVMIERVGSLAHAPNDAISFLANPHYRADLPGTRAKAVILDADSAAPCPVAALISPNPYATYARIAAFLNPPPRVAPGIHPSASVAKDAQVDPSACVAAFAVVGCGARIGAGALVGPHCVLEGEVELGAEVHLSARVTLCRGVRIGERTLIQPGAVIGGDGFGFAPDSGGWVKVPQLGGVRIGADVEIGANTTIDRGAIDDTVIEDGAKLDNQIQVGHNCVIGAHTAIAGCVGISGSTIIGKRCMVGGGAGIVGHLSICDDVVITGFSLISHSIERPGVYSSGIPAEEARLWRRIVGRIKQLDSIGRRLVALERTRGGPSTQEEPHE